MFADVLRHDDARRAGEVVELLRAQGFRFALTGGLAIDARLRAQGRLVQPRHLNDIDIVVESVESIPESLAASFLLHHVHPHATDGRMLLQLVDPKRAVRVDVFGALGESFARAHPLNKHSGSIDVLSVEDLVARTTAFICGRLRRGVPIDVKHAASFRRLHGLGEPLKLAAAWTDHRQQVVGTFAEASRSASQLLEAHPELMVEEKYDSNAVPCERCQPYGPFRPSPAATIAQILGYC